MNSILKVRDSATGEWINIPAIVGPQGDAGATGPAGKNGVDGITPHIGANGNWYIGETDTGMPSRGEEAPQESVLYIPQNLTPEQQARARENISAVPSPDTAEVGQAQVVTAVDENGKPTQWEPVDLPTGDWQQVFDFTSTEEIDVLEIDVTDIADALDNATSVSIYFHAAPVSSADVLGENPTGTIQYHLPHVSIRNVLSNVKFLPQHYNVAGGINQCDLYLFQQKAAKGFNMWHYGIFPQNRGAQITYNQQLNIHPNAQYVNKFIITANDTAIGAGSKFEIYVK